MDYILHDICTSSVWNVLTAISTCAAVIVSLYLANRPKRLVRKLHISQQFIEDYDNGKIYLLVTIENVGNVPIALNNYGCKFNKRNDAIINIQKYLDGEYELIVIHPDDVKVIRYTHNFGRKYQEDDETICNSFQYKLFKESKFMAEDTLGNFYC